MGSIPGWCFVHSGLGFDPLPSNAITLCSHRVIRESSDDPAGYFHGDFHGVFLYFRGLTRALLHALLAFRPDDVSSRQ